MPMFASWRGPAGHPIFRLGGGSRQVLSIPGLSFTADLSTEKDIAPLLKNWLPAIQAHDLDFWNVGRRGNLPKGTTAQDIADDYANVVRNEMAAPVGVIGVSTGGPYAMQLAIRHPELVDRLVLAFTAHRLSARSAALQRRFGEHALRGNWRSAYAMLGRFMYPRFGPLAGALFWLIGPSQGGTPTNLPVLPVDLDAEEAHDATGQLGQIRCPTLLVSGGRDSGYPPDLVREMVAAIPGAQHVEFPKLGHDPSGATVAQAVTEFLG